ncbi:nucleotidyltransferase domain-containing protein [Alkaliphilus pronyensis]|uniref:Nucleotidyltransferase domain-containing protein n=1 Tax=Alkaliphilus pronyensis TaxID=1482732 RepID=A0A6I0F191_9FIRM|nr:nucleotidyltransferase domain-containing protein [Alkaliphilus pronyensis]KAB3534722.1 nucleotidyltransferase domain-containing protein [Alkaliphilus pronyensis]
MSFGISPKSLDIILNTLINNKEVERVVIFGSRSMGNYKNGSDIDIAIYGPDISEVILNNIRVELNEILPLPYYFDIIHYETLENLELKEHIDKHGSILYKRQ